ncbi:MAG: ABC transporter permease [Enterococcus sp.]
MKKKLYPAISMVLILVIWQVSVWLTQVPSFILPGPIAVLQAFCANFKELLSHSATTLTEGVLGLVVASLLSFVTALLMDYFSLLKRSVYPLLVISQTLPIMVLGPLLTLWFGFGMLPKIILVVLMSYFPIVVSFADGLQKTELEQVNFMKTMGASDWQIYQMLKIPQGMNGFFSGLKVAATYCIGGAIVGEWLSAESGLGYFMIRAKNSYQIDKVFAALVCVVLLSLGLNLAVALLKKSYYRSLYQRRN